MLEEDGIENPQILLNEMNRHIKKKQREFRDLKRAEPMKARNFLLPFSYLLMEISLEKNNSFQEKIKMARKLYRSSKQRMIAGICGGLAEYFDMDVNIMRLLFVAISLLSVLFPMVIFYIIAWIIVPEKEKSKKSQIYILDYLIRIL